MRQISILLITLLTLFNALGCEKSQPKEAKRTHPSLEKKIKNPIDGAYMVLIPKGVFLMGAVEGDKLADSSEKPLREVYLDDYYIYVHEVTREQFHKFVTSTGYVTTAEKQGSSYTWRSNYSDKTKNYPVVFISWYDAQAYCHWAGGHLPTEAEWEKAARGTKLIQFPWGNKMDYSRFNSELSLNKKEVLYKDSDDEDDTPLLNVTKPVGSYPKGSSPYGVMDMMGNVWEWCFDWFGVFHPKFEGYLLYDPRGPMKGDRRILKGGGFCNDPSNYRISARDKDYPNAFSDDYGIRVVVYPQEMGKQIAPPQNPHYYTLILNPKDDSVLFTFWKSDIPKGFHSDIIKDFPQALFVQPLKVRFSFRNFSMRGSGKVFINLSTSFWKLGFIRVPPAHWA